MVDIDINPFSVVKWSFKLGSWISNNIAADDLLTKLAQCLKKAMDSESNDKSIKIIQEFITLSDQYNGNQKCQDALFYFLNAQAYFLLGLNHWVKYEEDIEELANSGEYFKKAESFCKFAIEIRGSRIFSNTSNIHEIQQKVKEMLNDIRTYSSKWEAYYKHLFYHSPIKWMDFKEFKRDNINRCMFSCVLEPIFFKINNAWK